MRDGQQARNEESDRDDCKCALPCTICTVYLSPGHRSCTRVAAADSLSFPIHDQALTRTRFNAAGSGHDATAAHHHQRPAQTEQKSDARSASPSSARFTHSFHPTHPPEPTAEGSSTMPSLHNGMDLHGQAPRVLATASAADEESETQRTLFGDVPEHKRRKFILVDDVQRGTRVRVRVMLLDQVKLDDMPDAHLRTNAVYPRSYYPRQMRQSPRCRTTIAASSDATSDPDDNDDDDGGEADDDDPMEGVSGTLPTIGRTLVPVKLVDGSSTNLAVPRMTRIRRSKELALNELGYRMSWGQARTFNRRTLFLQRSRKSCNHHPGAALRDSAREEEVVAEDEEGEAIAHREKRGRWRGRGFIAFGRDGSGSRKRQCVCDGSAVAALQVCGHSSDHERNEAGLTKITGQDIERRDSIVKRFAGGMKFSLATLSNNLEPDSHRSESCQSRCCSLEAIIVELSPPQVAATISSDVQKLRRLPTVLPQHNPNEAFLATGRDACYPDLVATG
nr:hypothetical protein CFP56_36467 [Quercus suber]